MNSHYRKSKHSFEVVSAESLRTRRSLQKVRVLGCIRTLVQEDVAALTVTTVENSPRHALDHYEGLGAGASIRKLCGSLIF
ncbi:hypothetical protein EVAR_3548_1 [Eumeta japonica]|uniref:Uncharacterized protein n=1 Tax=Eumeta variegata TaxID=151549 RepID=A0A4C1SW87_EUMVA|nr:hypothetical protein EVAR_3548_1 [Eumeta japonica]